MEPLPPVGWADVATKHDLDHLGALLRTELHTEIAGVRADMATLESRLTDKMAEQTRTLMLAIVGSMVTISGVAFGAARLAV